PTVAGWQRAVGGRTANPRASAFGRRIRGGTFLTCPLKALPTPASAQTAVGSRFTRTAEAVSCGKSARGEQEIGSIAQNHVRLPIAGSAPSTMASVSFALSIRRRQGKFSDSRDKTRAGTLPPVLHRTARD